MSRPFGVALLMAGFDDRGAQVWSSETLFSFPVLFFSKKLCIIFFAHGTVHACLTRFPSQNIRVLLQRGVLCLFRGVLSARKEVQIACLRSMVWVWVACVFAVDVSQHQRFQGAGGMRRKWTNNHPGGGGNTDPDADGAFGGRKTC